MNLAQNAVETINSYRSNKIIMDFVTNEAHEKVASEFDITVLGASFLKQFDKEIANRVSDYIEAGLIGCYMAACGSLWRRDQTTNIRKEE